MDRKKINVTLREINDKHLLEFDFQEKLVLELSSNNQEDTKKLFSDLLKNLIKEKFELNFIKEEGYSKEIIYEVAIEYIKELNKEIDEIIEDEDFINYSKID